MSRWSEEFKKHPIHRFLDELESLSRTKPGVSDAQTREEFRRFLKVIRTFKKVLKGMDPELISSNYLNQLHNHFTRANILQYLRNYQSTGIVDHLIHANNHLESTLSYLASYPKIMPQPRKIPELEKALDDALEKLDKINTRLKEEREELQTLEDEIALSREQTQEQVTQWQKQFSEAQERRNIEYNEWRQKTDKSTQADMEKITQKVEDILDKKKKDFSKLIEVLTDDAKEKHQRIQDLYGLLASDSISADYITNAKTDKRTADWWRRICVLFIIVAAGWLFYAFFADTGTSGLSASVFSWAKFLTTFSLTGVLLSGAAYAARQSAIHRAIEKQQMRFALEVKAFDPFIHSLNEERQWELKQKMTERIFGNSPDIVNSNSKQRNPLRRTVDSAGE